MSNIFKAAGFASVLALLASPAFAQVAYDNASTYSSGYGMNAGSANQAVNPSLRDANGNLELVNGQFQTSTMSQATGVQNMGSLGSNNSGVGFGSSPSVTPGRSVRLA